MATIVHNRTTRERRFTVPVTGRPAGSPFTSGPVEIVLDVDRSGRPTEVRLRYRPNTVEFHLKLSKLVKAGGLKVSPHTLSRQAATGRPVVDFRADAALVAGLPGDIDDTFMLEALFMAHGEALLDARRYRPVEVSFEG